VQRIVTLSKPEIEQFSLQFPSAIICMADELSLLPRISDTANIRNRINLIFNDCGETTGRVIAPNEKNAKDILAFSVANSHLPQLVFQCTVGVGRSRAAAAAILRIRGDLQTEKAIRFEGTYNHKLYSLILKEAGQQVEQEKLVSMVVRVKYDLDIMLAFALCMKRQRYSNLEVIFVTDGPNPRAAGVVEQFAESAVKFRLIETPEAKGRWGHPYRQLGIDSARGEYIGLSNDDNYYVPGYIEQMVNALESADFAVCDCVHSYKAWDIHPQCSDVGSWLGRASLIRSIPFPGTEQDSDWLYFQHLSAGGRTVVVKHPLFVHN
jgi:predicted protein tyrosine phosphatase